MNPPDSVIRAVRGFVQSFIGIFLALTVTGGMGDVPDLNMLKSAALAASWGAFIAFLAFVQNALEDKTGKALLK